MIKVNFKLYVTTFKKLFRSNNACFAGKLDQNAFISPSTVCNRGFYSSHIKLVHDSANARPASLLSDKIISGWIRSIDESKTFEDKLKVLHQLSNFRTEDGRQMVSNERVMKAIEHSLGTEKLTIETAASYLNALADAGATLENQASLILPSLEIIASQPKKLLNPFTLPELLQTLLKLNVNVNQTAALHNKILKMVENSLTIGLAELDEVALIFKSFAVGLKPSSIEKAVAWLEKVSVHGYSDLQPDLHTIVRFLAGVSSTGVQSNDEIMSHARRMLYSMTEQSLVQTLTVARLDKAARMQILSLLESIVSLQISFPRDKSVRLGLMVSNAVDAYLPLANKSRLPTILQAMYALDVHWQKLPPTGKTAITSKLMELSWETDSSVLTESLLWFSKLGPRWINLENQLFQRYLVSTIVPASLAVEVEEETESKHGLVDQNMANDKLFYKPEDDKLFEDDEVEDVAPMKTLGSEQQTDMLQFFSFLKIMGALRTPFNLLSGLEQDHLLFSAHFCTEYLDVNELGDLLQALGRMGVSVRDLLEDNIIKEAFKSMKRSKEYTGPGLCSLFRGLQDARYNWQQLSNDETQTIFDAIAKFQSSKQDVDCYPLVIHSFAGLGLFWNNFPPTAKRDILRMIGETSSFGWDGFALSKVIFALGKMKLEWQDMPPWLQDSLLDALNNDGLVLEDPHSFYLTVQGLAKMKVRWTPPFYQPLQEQFVHIKHISPVELSLCLMSLAHAQASWNTFSDSFKIALAQHFQSLLPELRSDRSVGSILYSIAMFAFDANVESDRALLQILVEVKKRLEDDWGPERFKDVTLRREAQIFFEFLATFPFGQSMIADIYGKRREDRFIPTFLLERDVIAKRDERNDEIFDYLVEVVEPYDLIVQRDVSLFRGIYITSFAIVNPNNDNQCLAYVDAGYSSRASLGRKRLIKEHLYNFHFPNKPTCLVDLKNIWSWQQQLDELMTQICFQNNLRLQGLPAPPARLKEN